MAEQAPHADTSRGIRNTQARFADTARNRLTSEQLLKHESFNRQNEGGSDNQRNSTGTPSKNTQILQQITRAKDTLRQFFQESGIAYDANDAEMLIKNKPVRPDFPFFMVAIAAMKDILDIPIELSIVGIVITTVLSFLLALVIFFWLWGKLSGGWWKRRMVGWLWRRYIFAMVIEFIPFFKMIPATTILILMAHYRETKIVQLFDSALERLHRKDIPGL